MQDHKGKMLDFCKNIANSLQIGLMATHVDGEVCFINDTFARMFNIDKSTAIGSSIERYFPNSEHYCPAKHIELIS